MFFLNWAEARGFSGFEDDEDTTCNHIVKELNEAGIYEPPQYVKANHPELVKPNGLLKRYIPPREYLRRI